QARRQRPCIRPAVTPAAARPLNLPRRATLSVQLSRWSIVGFFRRETRDGQLRALARWCHDTLHDRNEEALRRLVACFFLPCHHHSSDCLGAAYGNSFTLA